MILVEILVCAAGLALLLGGSLRNLEVAPLRGEALLIILLPAQLLWPRLAALRVVPCSWSILVWLAMMAALIAVLLVNVRTSPVLLIAALGIAANILVISMNGAMPVSIRAASEMGATRAEARAALENDCLHTELTQRTRLALLADIVVVPGPSWQRGVVSVGDLLLGLGLGGWVFTATRRARD